ncbi:histidinol-phosphatase [uncultured Victivallis sp.]|uniref:histidinol-phosphatase n=1 Tax=uncultured Victivallis sp. TaxID=354118 RepID=UPI0025E4DD19|nr:histidinol-phosphatase [uncultured Victivallis sp.]
MKQPLRVNLHTHTRRCKHAQGEISDYCAEAVRQNVAVLGFSDHSPFPGGEYASTRMDFAELADYCDDIRRAREAFPDLTVLAGLEADYLPALGPSFYREVYLGEYGLDYLIGAVHFTRRAGELIWVGDITPEETELVRGCIEESIQMMENGLIAYLAHPDMALVRFRTWTPELAALYRDLMQASATFDIPLEINAYGFRKPPVQNGPESRRQYPWNPVWELAAECGVKTVIGADAHKPVDVWSNMPEVFDYSRQFGLANYNEATAARLHPARKTADFR